ncbi:MAG: VWA domain-containing protein [Acidobacteriaceae bacterium]
MLRFALPLLLAMMCGNLFGQDPIRVNVNLVNVAFTARDARGALVSGLTQSDVQVFEDGAPQRIAFFSQALDVPLTLGLVVDVSGSQDHFTKQHQHDLEVFLKSVLRPEDRVFLVCFGNHLRLVSDDSNSANEVLERLKEFQHHGGDRFSELGPKEERDLGTAFYDSIYYPVTEKLAGATGRRALLVFSDGEDNSSSHNMMDTIEAAQRANVQVYTIRYTEKEHGRLTARNKYGISVMDRIAAETGSMHIDASTTDPHNYFQQIGDELRSSYELAYYPANPLKDNTFRKITIKAKQPGLTIRARTGYFSR